MSGFTTVANVGKAMYDTAKASGAMPSATGMASKAIGKVGLGGLVSKQAKGLAAPLGLLALIRLPQILGALQVMLVIACVAGIVVFAVRRHTPATQIGTQSRTGFGKDADATRQQIQSRRRTTQRC